MVTGVVLRETGYTYCVTWAHTLTEQAHFACELSSEKTLTGSYQ